ncbi:MAG TPA: SIMPL domain-containing protein [Thermomicrobiales bacterium]|nr:SIMPL domain-containing protein [Thermomicrobiales bacterium]
MLRNPFRRVAVALILGIVLLFPPLASAQMADDVTPGITATGYGQASAPADSATIQLSIASESFGPPQPMPSGGTPGAAERNTVAPIVKALVDAGIPEDTINVLTGPYVTAVPSMYGPTMAMIRFEVPNPTANTISSAVDAAIIGAADARLIIGALSVQLESADCAALEHDARAAAIADAREQAEVLAELTGLTTGAVVAVRDVPTGPESGYMFAGPTFLSGCSPFESDALNLDVYGGASYDPTQEPMVTAYAQVEMTFSTAAGPVATPAG